MRPRQYVTSLALVGAAIALGVYAHVDRGSISDTERRDREHDVFPAYRRADIDAIELTQGKATLRLARTAPADGGDPGWDITSPLVETADPAAVDRLIGDLEFAGAIRKIDPSSATGFDSPRLTGTLSMKPLVYHFALGGPAPIPEGAAYFRVDGEGTFVVSRDFVKSLLQTAGDYRNRSVVPYLSIKTQRLEITSPAGTLDLERADDVSFRFARGGPRASRDAMDRVWGALAEARAESFLPDAEADRALDPAAVHVRMVPTADSGPAAEFALGGVCPGKPDSVVFVRRPPKISNPACAPRYLACVPVSACVPKGAVPGLLTPRDEIVDRRLFASRADEIEEVSLESIPPAKTLEIARKGRGWHERKPVDRELVGPEAEAANALVNDLVRSEGDGLPTSSPAPNAKAEVRISRSGGTKERVLLAASGDGVWRAADASSLHVSPATSHRMWPSGIALRSASVFPQGFAGLSPTSLSVRCAATETLTHDSSGWTMREPHGFRADSVATSDLLALVQNAQADSWIADADDGTFGFAKSPCEVEVAYSGEAGTRKTGLVFGNEARDGSFYAHVLGESPVFLAPRLLREGPDTLLVDRGGFRIDPRTIRRIALARGTTTRTLDMAQERRDAGGRDAVGRVASVLETLRPDVVLHLGPATPGEGFATPTLDVRVELRPTDGGAQSVHFILGDTAMVGRQRVVFARIDGVDATFGIAHDRVGPLIDAL